MTQWVVHGWIATGSLAQADEDKEAKKAKGDAESGWFINVYNGKIWEILVKMDDFGGSFMKKESSMWHGCHDGDWRGMGDLHIDETSVVINTCIGKCTLHA